VRLNTGQLCCHGPKQTNDRLMIDEIRLPVLVFGVRAVYVEVPPRDTGATLVNGRIEDRLVLE